jgi:two-component system, OmpR family, aerobic respiration control sensor histidine kinase ArcB
MSKENLPNDVAALKEYIKSLEQECAALKEENKKIQDLQNQQTEEFAELYEKTTGEKQKNRWDMRDYALAIYHYLDSILALAPGHIFWMDRHNVFLGCNNAQAKSANLKSRDEIIGKTNSDLPWKEEAAQLDATNSQVMELNKSIILEEEGETAYGHQVYLSEKVPLKNKQGEVIGLLGTSIDITQQKEAMKASEIAKQKAEEASWAKSEFIQNMSHDLKNPLMSVMGMAEFLAETEFDEGRKEHLMMIHRAGARMLDMFTNILDVASLEAGDVAIKHDSVDIRKLFQGIRELYEPLMHQKNIYLRINIADAVPATVVTDPMRIQRVLLNLIGNALKFTKEGGVTVSADVEHESATKKYLLLSVADTGIGMPADKLELIFEKFVRLASAYEGVYPGTGLGLGIVKKFVEELGGLVKVESQEGKGTTFTCKLPLTSAI